MFWFTGKKNIDFDKIRKFIFWATTECITWYVPPARIVAAVKTRFPLFKG